MTELKYRYDKNSGYIYHNEFDWECWNLEEMAPSTRNIITHLFTVIEDTNTRLEGKERTIELLKYHIETRDMTDEARRKDDLKRFDYDW